MSQESTRRHIADLIKNALKHYHNPEWLGTHSPLATAYFLGEHLTSLSANDTSSEACGRVLQVLLREASNNLWQGARPASYTELKEQVPTDTSDKRFEFYLLELYYLREFIPGRAFPRQNNKQELASYLSMSQPTLFRWIAKARESLLTELLKLVRTISHAENPQNTTPIIGRQSMLEQIHKELQQSKSITITGMAGAGKTALGTAVYAEWKQCAPAFWFTVRPQLNDQLSSVLFALANFLKKHDAVTLWSQLLINNQEQNPSLLLGCLTRDIQSLKTPPLLCFDEVDRLRTAFAVVPNPHHSAILELLELLVSLTPTLLIGQQGVIDTQIHKSIEGLSLTDTENLLQIYDETLSDTTQKKWHQWTNGNPRLLHLCAMLHRNGEKISKSSIDLSGPFQRLWRRLSANEKDIVIQLSVYRNGVSSDNWQSQKSTLKSLIKRQLVIQAKYDQVSLLPTWRRYIYNYILLPEVREHAHAQAYAVRLQNGEFTSAVYHSIKAGDLTQAIDIWYKYHDLEIERGFGTAAQEIFINLSPKQIPDSHQEKFLIIRNKFFELSGDFDAILATSSPRPSIVEVTPEAVELDEQVARATFRRTGSDEALEVYEIGLTRIAKLMSKAAKIHHQRGQLLLDLRQMDEVSKEIGSIYVIQKRLEAELARRKGDLIQTEKILADLVDSAEMPDTETQYHLHRQLAAIYSQLGKWEPAVSNAELAHDFYAESGNLVFEHMMQMQLSAIHMQARNFEKAIEYGRRALEFFEEINHLAVMPYVLNYLAESYLGIGELEEAERFAHRAYREESHSEFPNTCYTLGLVHKKRKQYQLALEVFSKGIDVSEINGDKFLKAYLIRERSKVYVELGETEKAIVDKQMSSELFTHMGLQHEIET